MSNKTLKILIFSFLFFTNLIASNKTLEKELNNIKIEIEKLKITQKYQDSSRKIKELEKSISDLESKYIEEKIDKKLINKDFEKYNKELEFQNKRISDVFSNIQFWGILFSLIALITGFIGYIINKKYAEEAKKEAKEKAQEELQSWIDQKADDEFEVKVEKYLQKVEDKGNLVLEKIENMAIDKLDEEIRKFDLARDKVTEEFKRNLDKSAKNLEMKNEEELDSEQLYELFLSKYFKEKYKEAHDYIDKAIKHSSKKDLLGKYLFAKALTYKDDNEIEEAIKHYKMAIEKEHSGSMNNLGYLYVNEEKYKDIEEAIKYYKMAIEKEHSDAMFNLANLYRYENGYKDIEEAIKYYKLAVEKEHSAAMNNLSWLYYEENMEKTKSLELVQNAINIKKDKDILHTLSMVELWNNNYIDSLNVIKELINQYGFKGFNDDIKDYLILLLVKEQYKLANNLFEEFSNLKEVFSIIYNALQKLENKETNFDETTKEEVDKVLEQIKEKAEKYK